MGLGDPSAFVSAAEYAYAMLRAGIENGELPPGKRLRETEVSDWLGVSRTPVRQALSRLQTEGLLASGSRSGLVVATLDSDAVTELYEIREVLEGTAAAFAARNATPAEIEALKGMIAEERQLTKTPEALARHNIRFHRALHVAAQPLSGEEPERPPRRHGPPAPDDLWRERATERGLERASRRRRGHRHR